MPNTILTPDMIVKEALTVFQDTDSLLRMVDKQYDDYYARAGAKIGSTLRLKMPLDFVVNHGQNASPQDGIQNSISLTMANQSNVAMQFNSVQLTLSMDRFREDWLYNATVNLVGDTAAGLMSGAEAGAANYVDLQAAGAIVSPNATTIATANAMFASQSAPSKQHLLVVSPFTDARVAASLTGLFNPAPTISEQFRTANMKSALGFNWYMDQTVIQHTAGTFTTGTVNGANQTGSTLVVNATGGTLKKGDFITLASVNRVNRVMKASVGRLMQFTVTADTPAGSTAIPIYPPIIPAGSNGAPVQYQTCDASPANNATITLLHPAGATFTKNIAFIPEAIQFVTADLDIPPNVEAAREVYHGVSLRYTRQWAGMNDVTLARLDMIWGAIWARPEWVVIVADIAG